MGFPKLCTNRNRLWPISGEIDCNVTCSGGVWNSSTRKRYFDVAHQRQQNVGASGQKLNNRFISTKAVEIHRRIAHSEAFLAWIINHPTQSTMQSNDTLALSSVCMQITMDTLLFAQSRYKQSNKHLGTFLCQRQTIHSQLTRMQTTLRHLLHCCVCVLESYLHVVSGVMNALIMHFETRLLLFVLRRVPASAQWHRPDYLQAINLTAACTRKRLRADGVRCNKHHLIVKVEQHRFVQNSLSQKVSDGFRRWLENSLPDWFVKFFHSRKFLKALASERLC